MSTATIATTAVKIAARLFIVSDLRFATAPRMVSGAMRVPVRSWVSSVTAVLSASSSCQLGMGFCLTWVIPAAVTRVLPGFTSPWSALSEARLSLILLADAESTDLYICDARADAAAATPTPMSEPVRPICDWSKNEVIAASALAMTVENERSSKSFLSSPSSRLVSVVVMCAFAVSAKTTSPSLRHTFPLRAGLLWQMP